MWVGYTGILTLILFAELPQQGRKVHSAGYRSTSACDQGGNRAQAAWWTCVPCMGAAPPMGQKGLLHGIAHTAADIDTISMLILYNQKEQVYLLFFKKMKGCDPLKQTCNLDKARF